LKNGCLLNACVRFCGHLPFSNSQVQALQLSVISPHGFGIDCLRVGVTGLADESYNRKWLPFEMAAV
jgi:hypothetical protein